MRFFFRHGIKAGGGGEGGREGGKGGKEITKRTLF